MSIAPVIMWFRRDLRLSDNSALNAALRSGSPIICVFVFDPVILKSRNIGAPRMAFLLKALLSLDTALLQYGGKLCSAAEILDNPIVEYHQRRETRRHGKTSHLQSRIQI